MRFVDAMDRLGPFEYEPHIAIAVSGGGDSIALTYFAHEWARANGGQITVLTVDHGLRSDSRSEAERVGGWINALGITHQILNWQGVKPKSRIQAMARNARYRLMDDWCKDNGVLHLLVAHNENDQAETYLMRKEHGSGPDGLAAMSQILELSHCRLLRPLLAENTQNLRHFLMVQNAKWVEDPSNQNPIFERVRMRLHIKDEKISCLDVATTAAQFGNSRLRNSRALSALIAFGVQLSPLGFAYVNLSVLTNASSDDIMRLFARVLMTVGGRSYAPSRTQLEFLVGKLLNNSASSVTGGGCQVIHKRDGFLVAREKRGLPLPVLVAPKETIHWDHRFKMTFGEGLSLSNGNVFVRALEDQDWAEVKLHIGKSQQKKIKAVIRHSLPALCDDTGVFAVPHFGFFRKDIAVDQGNSCDILAYLSFCPLNSMSDMGFSVASPIKPTISVSEGG
ncbi:MAG: tRNA lysidine(34) synthetase TilS [Rhodospirillales bacterium]